MQRTRCEAITLVKGWEAASLYADESISRSLQAIYATSRGVGGQDQQFDESDEDSSADAQTAKDLPS